VQLPRQQPGFDLRVANRAISALKLAVRQRVDGRFQAKVPQIVTAK
jgi:hypothetical protein